MPGRGQPLHAFRLPEEIWERFGQAAAAMGTERGTAIREFIAWYVREPGAELPPRPPELPAVGGTD